MGSAWWRLRRRCRRIRCRNHRFIPGQLTVARRTTAARGTAMPVSGPPRRLWLSLHAFTEGREAAMTASAEAICGYLPWSPADRADRPGEDGAGVARRLWVAGVALSVLALAAGGLAGAIEQPGSAASRSSESAIAGLPLPFRAAISRVVGADAREYAAVRTQTGAMMHNARQGLSGRFSAMGASVHVLEGETRHSHRRVAGFGRRLQRGHDFRRCQRRRIVH